MGKIAFSIFLFGITLVGSVRAETIVVGGKPYKLEPAKLNVCGDVGGPEYAAAVGVLAFAQKFGESTYSATCASGAQTKCTDEDVRRFGVEQVFTAIREYPSALRSISCKQLRAICETKCNEAKVFDANTCLIECNQYESWNR